MTDSSIDLAESSSRVAHLFQLFDQAALGNLSPADNYLGMPMGTLKDAQPFGSSVRSKKIDGADISARIGAQVSPQTDTSGSRTSADGASPRAIKAPFAQSARPIAHGRKRPHAGAKIDQGEDIIEIPKQLQKLASSEELGRHSVFTHASPWLSEGPAAGVPMFPRKSSDGVNLLLMVEELNAQNGLRFDDNAQDPLDTSLRADSASVDNGTNAAVQHFPFGQLVLPISSESSNDAVTRSRRSTTIIKPHWTQTPRILVVEDDVVYRQLSSKFLEKFGCITDMVDDAQGAVEKMNQTKYDLVLMDVFFGPLMDG